MAENTKNIELDFREEISQLCNAVEQTIGYSLNTPKDFQRLSEVIFERMRGMVSASTLKRLWGYVESGGTPRISTLNILSRFVGFHDWESFRQADFSGRASGAIMYRHLNVSKDLQRGQKLRLRWSPGRICDVCYQGNQQFLVLDSVNTGLKKDATFSCPLIIEGEPLYLDDVRQREIPVGGYVCGKSHGVYFEELD